MATFLDRETRSADRYALDAAHAEAAPLVSHAPVDRAGPAPITSPWPVGAQPAGWIGRLLLPGATALPAASRLVVLVPDNDVDEPGLAACIWDLASPHGLAVLLVGTLARPQGHYRARRRLVSIAAITRDDAVQVDHQLALDQDWRKVVRQVWQPGDLVVCPAELTTPVGLGRRPLAPALLERLAAPVYAVSGFFPHWSPERSRGWAQLSGWLPPLLIVAAFFALQAQLTQATTGGLQTILLVLTVMVEFGLIAAWEKHQNTLL